MNNWGKHGCDLLRDEGQAGSRERDRSGKAEAKKASAADMSGDCCWGLNEKCVVMCKCANKDWTWNGRTPGQGSREGSARRRLLVVGGENARKGRCGTSGWSKVLLDKKSLARVLVLLDCNWLGWRVWRRRGRVGAKRAAV